MAGQTLTTLATLQCPHGGTVQIITTNVRTKANGAPIVTTADTFIITGCPFQIPAPTPIPSPCVTVRWLVPDLRAKVNGNPTLSMGSTGLCLSAQQVPQGPVIIVNAQARVKTQ